MTNSADADHAAPNRPSRRALLGVGAIGSALALATSRSVSASASGLSESDVALATFGASAELSARDLYADAIAAGAVGDIWEVLRSQHSAYAQSLSALSGVPADTRDDDLYEAASDGFNRNNPSVEAMRLENTAAATHTEILATVEDPTLASAIASIAAMEAHHAVVTAGIAQRADDLDALLTNTATALSPEA